MFTFPRPGEFGGSVQPIQPARTDSAELNQLRGDVERLFFITEALWRILKETHGLEDQEIIRQIAVIDAEDGKIDGKKAPRPPEPCPKCGRTLVKQRPQCLYCGEFIAANPFDR